MMLDEADVDAALRVARSRGADFAEVYADARTLRSLHLAAGAVDRLGSGYDAGAGVRVVHAGRTGYAFTNGLDGVALLTAARAAAATVRGGERGLADLRTPSEHDAATGADPPRVSTGALVELATAAHDGARAVDAVVQRVAVSYADIEQDVYIANSDGHRSTQRRARTRLVVDVVAAADGAAATAQEGIARSAGHELFAEHRPEGIGRRAGERAVRMLGAEPAPSGETVVVLGPGAGGTLFHEACGHGMEGDLVAGGGSVYAGRLGQRLCPLALIGVDDATVPDGWGSFSFDDEGTAAQRTAMIEGGVCSAYLTDRVRAEQLGGPSTGNARRRSYAHAPLPRMTNSYLLPGKDEPGEIVRSTPSGVYCRTLGGGMVDHVTGDFTFAMTEAYRIENGELTVPVRGATIVGDGPTVLSRIDAIGSDFAVREGVCAKGNQRLPVGLGAPTLRISRASVGGAQR